MHNGWVLFSSALKRIKNSSLQLSIGKWGGIHCSGLCSMSLTLNVSLLPPALCSAEMDLVYLVLVLKAGQEGAVICCPPIRTSHFCEIQTQLLPLGEKNASPVMGITEPSSSRCAAGQSPPGSIGPHQLLLLLHVVLKSC